MAKQVGIIKFSGKLDETVGRRTMKGNVSIGKAPRVVNPNTQKQQKQRTRFLAAVSIANAIPESGLAGLKPYAKSHRIGIRQAASKNFLKTPEILVPTAIIGGNGFEAKVENHPSGFSFSRGTLLQPIYVTLNNGTAMKLKIDAAISGYTENEIARMRVIFVTYNLLSDVWSYLDATPVVNTGEDADVAPYVAKAELTVPWVDGETSTSVYAWCYIQLLGENTNTYYDYTNQGATSEVNELETGANYSPTVYGGVSSVRYE